MRQKSAWRKTLLTERYTYLCAILQYLSLTSPPEIINGFNKRPPLFQANYKATYSNIAFVLLGFALENMTGLPYAEIVQSTVFDPIGMSRATLTKPLDSEGIIPNVTNDWRSDIGTYGPTGGIYTTVSDLALFARSILTNRLLDIATTNAWFHPHSYSSSWSFAYGMPWEIFRTSDMLLDSDRIQTIITKAGGLRGYQSQLLMIPEYNVGLVVLVAAGSDALAWLRAEILKRLIPVIEDIARTQTTDRLSGTYTATDIAINSSISVKVQGSSGLVVTSWISNSTDFLAQYVNMSNRRNRSGKVQLTPAKIKRGENGEVWRAQLVVDELPSKGIGNINLIEDVDSFTYASRSIDEFVFELDADGRATDWSTHKLLCSQFAATPKRPGPTLKRAILLPEEGPSSKVVKVECQPLFGKDDVELEGEIPQLERFMGFARYRPLSNTRNFLRGRRFKGELQFIHHDDYLDAGSKVNMTVESIVREKPPNRWRGPVVILKAVSEDAETYTNINMTDYRNAVNHLAMWKGSADYDDFYYSHFNGKVKGVRVNFLGDESDVFKIKYMVVDVPKDHPLFLSKVASISKLVELPVQAYHNPPNKIWKVKDRKI
ncbi:MAG: hypothetical protein Q9166_007924 [cf. Caloplaca sp. 2 TL-2023]